MAYNGYSDYFEKELIITVAVTGGLHGKDTNKNIPEQPAEIARDVAACEEAGASIVHVHARDQKGRPAKDPKKFEEIHELIKEHCDDIIVQYTTGGRSFDREERIAPVLESDPQPEMASIDMGPKNSGQTEWSTHPRDEHEEYAQIMLERGIKPELELFNRGMLTEVQHLIEQDLLDEPVYCNLIFGMQTGTLPHPRNLINFVDNLPDGTEWNCMAIGKQQLPLTTFGIIYGGHVRVGMEDNVYYRKGEKVQSNAQLVERTARLAKELNRPIASPAGAREILNIE